MTLPAAPRAVVDAAGQPALGRFAGLADSFDWACLAAPYRRSRWWRRFHHKRWHYVALARDDLFCAVAIVDLGWTSTAFAYAFDRRQRKMVGAFSQDGLPGLGATLAASAHGSSSFRMPGSRIEIRASGAGAWELQLRCADFSIDARFAGATPQLLAVGLVEGGSVHATQKSAGMALDGVATIAGARMALAGGVASMDYSNGLLARDTGWRWACAHSLELGFNLQAGYFGANENALWLDGDLIALGPASFDYDSADPLAPWRVHTADGLLDLAFTPEGLRREDRNLVIASSAYVQPIGHFNGWVRAHADAPLIAIKDLPGGTEDHRSRW